jgi:hypothetical protein
MNTLIRFCIRFLSVLAVAACFLAFAVYGVVFFIVDRLYTMLDRKLPSDLDP